MKPEEGLCESLETHSVGFPYCAGATTQIVKVTLLFGLLVLAVCVDGGTQLHVYRYQVHLRGSAVAAPLASSSTSRQPQMSVQLSLAPTSNSSSSRGRACAPVATANRVYDTPDAALEGAASLAEDVALQVFTHYIPAAAAGVVDMEGMSVVQPGSSSSGSSAPEASQPPGQETAAAAAAAEGDSSDAVKRVVLSGADLMLWRLLLLVKLEAAAGQAIGQVALLAASGELQQDFRVSPWVTQHRCLGSGHGRCQAGTANVCMHAPVVCLHA